MYKFIFGLLLLSIMACSSGPKEINFGSDKCDFCSMNIMDKPYGTELVTDKGKVHKFDSSECMINYMHENQDKAYSHVLTCTMDNPGVLVDAKSSYFLVSENMPSPMGANITAYSTKELADVSQAENGGEVYDFERIKSLQTKHDMSQH